MKGVILAAGYGTRFLPASKTIPKEMFPILERPALDLIVEEFVESGIRDILIITSRRKKALEDYLDREMELEWTFEREKAEEKLAKITPADARFFFVRQHEMRGTGHALLLAQPFVGNDPFVVAYPDDIHFGSVPLARQLIDVYERTGCSVLATLHDPPGLNRYAVLELEQDGLHVRSMIEKPPVGEEPSREASIGRFLYSDGFLDALAEGWERHTSDGEFYHVYGLTKQMESRKVVHKQVEGERLDIGTPDGYLTAIIRFAAQNPEYREILKRELRLLDGK